MRQPRVIAGLAAAMLLLGGCAGETDEATTGTDSASGTVCASLSALETRITAAGASVDESTETRSATVGEAKDAVGQLQSGWRALQNALGVDAESEVSRFEEAQQAYSDALAQLEDSAELSDVQTQLESSKSELSSSYQELLTRLGC